MLHTYGRVVDSFLIGTGGIWKWWWWEGVWERGLFAIQSINIVVGRCYLQCTNGTKYSRMDQVKIVEDSLSKIWSHMVYLSSPHLFKFFKGCLPLHLLGAFLNTLPQIYLDYEFKCVLHKMVESRVGCM